MLDLVLIIIGTCVYTCINLALNVLAIYMKQQRHSIFSPWRMYAALAMNFKGTIHGIIKVWKHGQGSLYFHIKPPYYRCAYRWLASRWGPYYFFFI